MYLRYGNSLLTCKQKKASKALSWEKCAHKMLMKLTEGNAKEIEGDRSLLIIIDKILQSVGQTLGSIVKGFG